MFKEYTRLLGHAVVHSVYHSFFPVLLFSSVVFPHVLFAYIYWQEFHPLSAGSDDHRRQDIYRDVFVSLLDIGQGDSILIQTPGGSMLIDSGPPGGGLLRQLAARFPFYRNGIDMLLATHEDADHIGGFPALLQKYRTSLFFISTRLTKTSIAAALHRTIDRTHVPTIPALRGMRITFHWQDPQEGKQEKIKDGAVRVVQGDGAKEAHIDILFPTQVNESELNTNEGSVVAHFVYASASAMLTGDSPVSSELAIVKTTKPEYLKSDVLKVGHHGSRNSSGDDFLRAVAPVYAGISVGADNRYGHPNPEALGRIASDTTARVFRTDTQGRITFGSDGEDWAVKTEK